VARGGAYRIQSSTLNKEFQAPESTIWTEQPIADGLNGVVINSSYKLHTWSFSNMEGCDFEDLMTLFASQQNNNTQLTAMETDDYTAVRQDARYATTTYTDFLIKDVAPRTRGQPLYESVQVVFEVFVS
jgi:hypothetical protein